MLLQLKNTFTKELVGMKFENFGHNFQICAMHLNIDAFKMK